MIWLLALVAAPQTLSAAALEPSERGAKLSLVGSRPPSLVVHEAAAPPRLLLDWSGVELSPTVEAPEGLGPVEQVGFEQRWEEAEPVTRVVLVVASGTRFRMRVRGHTVELDLIGPPARAPKEKPPVAATRRPSVAGPAPFRAEGPWVEPLVVVPASPPALAVSLPAPPVSADAIAPMGASSGAEEERPPERNRSSGGAAGLVAEAVGPPELGPRLPPPLPAAPLGLPPMPPRSAAHEPRWASNQLPTELGRLYAVLAEARAQPVSVAPVALGSWLDRPDEDIPVRPLPTADDGALAAASAPEDGERSAVVEAERSAAEVPKRAAPEARPEARTEVAVAPARTAPPATPEPAVANPSAPASNESAPRPSEPRSGPLARFPGGSAGAEEPVALARFPGGAASKSESPVPPAAAPKATAPPTPAPQTTAPPPAPPPSVLAPPAPPSAPPPADRALEPAFERSASRANRGGSFVLGYIGFRQVGRTSRVFVRLDGPARYRVLPSVSDDSFVLELMSTTIDVENNSRPLDTQYFPGPVTWAQARRWGTSTHVEVRLRAPVRWAVKRIGTTVAIDFEEE